MMQDGGLNCKGALFCVVIVIEYFLDFFISSYFFLLCFTFSMWGGAYLLSYVHVTLQVSKLRLYSLPLRVVAQWFSVRVVREITLRPRGLKALRRL